MKINFLSEKASYTLGFSCGRQNFKSRPKISVVVPIYNQEKFVKSIYNMVKIFNLNKIEDLIMKNDNHEYIFKELTKTIPELMQIIGKKQELSHKYTIDIYIFKVLQNIITNPDYTLLSDDDKQVLVSAAILQDIGKEFYGFKKTDNKHPYKSAVIAEKILNRKNVPPYQKKRIINLIKNHEFFQAYNESYINVIDKLNDIEELKTKGINPSVKYLNTYKKIFEEKTKEIAYVYKNKQNFKLAKILAIANLKTINPDRLYAMPIKNSDNYIENVGFHQMITRTRSEQEFNVYMNKLFFEIEKCIKEKDFYNHSNSKSIMKNSLYKIAIEYNIHRNLIKDIFNSSKFKGNFVNSNYAGNVVYSKSKILSAIEFISSTGLETYTKEIDNIIEACLEYIPNFERQVLEIFQNVRDRNYILQFKHINKEKLEQAVKYHNMGVNDEIIPVLLSKTELFKELSRDKDLFDIKTLKDAILFVNFYSFKNKTIEQLSETDIFEFLNKLVEYKNFMINHSINKIIPLLPQNEYEYKSIMELLSEKFKSKNNNLKNKDIYYEIKLSNSLLNQCCNTKEYELLTDNDKCLLKTAINMINEKLTPKENAINAFCLLNEKGLNEFENKKIYLLIKYSDLIQNILNSADRINYFGKEKYSVILQNNIEQLIDTVTFELKNYNLLDLARIIYIARAKTKNIPEEVINNLDKKLSTKIKQYKFSDIVLPQSDIEGFINKQSDSWKKAHTKKIKGRNFFVLHSKEIPNFYVLTHSFPTLAYSDFTNNTMNLANFNILESVINEKTCCLGYNGTNKVGVMSPFGITVSVPNDSILVAKGSDLRSISKDINSVVSEFISEDSEIINSTVTPVYSDKFTKLRDRRFFSSKIKSVYFPEYEKLYEEELTLLRQISKFKEYKDTNPELISKIKLRLGQINVLKENADSWYVKKLDKLLNESNNETITLEVIEKTDIELAKAYKIVLSQIQKERRGYKGLMRNDDYHNEVIAKNVRPTGLYVTDESQIDNIPNQIFDGYNFKTPFIVVI